MNQKFSDSPIVYKAKQVNEIVVIFLQEKLGDYVKSDRKFGNPFNLKIWHTKHKFHIEYNLTELDLATILDDDGIQFLSDLKAEILAQDPECIFNYKLES